MRIAMIGNGKMGQSILKAALESGVEVVICLNSQSKEQDWDKIKEVDVCIDFSHPEAVLNNIKKVATFDKPMVIGTTGWYEELLAVQAFVEENNLALIYAHNFSIGMNIFMQIVANATKLINELDYYDIALSETHHKEKVDSPSGTALALGDMILKNVSRKKGIQTNLSEKKKDNDALYILSHRFGSVCGEHTVTIDSDQDSMTLSHRAHNRSVWAYGALKAAEWIQNRKGFFNIKDMLESKYATA